MMNKIFTKESMEQLKLTYINMFDNQSAYQQLVTLYSILEYNFPKRIDYEGGDVYTPCYTAMRNGVPKTAWGTLKILRTFYIEVEKNDSKEKIQNIYADLSSHKEEVGMISRLFGKNINWDYSTSPA